MEVSQIQNNISIKSKIKIIAMPIVLSLVLNFACWDAAFGKEKQTKLLKGELLKQQIQEYIQKDVMKDRDWYYEDSRLHQDMKQVLEEWYKLLEINNVFDNPKYVWTNNNERLSFEQRHEMDMIRVTYRNRINNHIDEVYRYVKILLKHLYYYKAQMLINPEIKTIRKMSIQDVDNKIIEFYKLTDDLIQLEKSISTQN